MKNLKCNLSIEDAKVEVVPQVIDNSLVIAHQASCASQRAKVKTRMVKAKMTAKKSRLEKATSHLYDLEDSHGPEKALNIDLGLIPDGRLLSLPSPLLDILVLVSFRKS